LSVPYETAPESAESPETPQEFLARLISRALNSFELSDTLLHRLDTALAHDSSLHSAHHSAGLHRITFRHTWLLADGAAVTLWELVHNTAPAPHAQQTASPPHEHTGHEHPRHEQAPSPESRREQAWVPDHSRSEQAWSPEQSRPERREGPWPEAPNGALRAVRTEQDQHELYADEQQLEAAMARLPLPLDQPTGFDLPFTVPLPPLPLPRHVYVPDNSADHARRLLRRAENPDRPDIDTLRLLGTASAHQISQAFGRPAVRAEARLAFSLYEHAFLLADGREVSLWEVEHTATPDGRHMCEVYATESAARRAMELRAARSSRTN
jgi:hypothetical protein